MASSPSSGSSSRGEHLLKADKAFASGSSWLAGLFTPGFHKILDRIDEGLNFGSLEADLPGGKKRILGERGPGPTAQIRLNNWRPLVRLMSSGSVGWYRSWAEGEWVSPDPVKLFDLFVRNRNEVGEVGRAQGVARWFNRTAHKFRRNDREQAKRNIEAHYDLGNDFYTAWLDDTMAYSSAVFEEPVSPEESFEAAQARKVRMLLDRLDLTPGDKLLEIGCGWGGLMEIAAMEYDVQVTGITLSTEQKVFAEKRLADARLAGSGTIELVDYRDVQGTYDAVASVEMVEAVGQEYWPDYLQAIADRLKPGGKAAIQLISINDDTFESYVANADFIQAYIFPGGLLISEERFEALAKQTGLSWQDRRGYGLHYAETLRRWRESFDNAIAEDRLPEGFDERFHNLWRYYLMYCEGGFRGGGIDVAQVTLVKDG